jgi:hypothetical protein
MGDYTPTITPQPTCSDLQYQDTFIQANGTSSGKTTTTSGKASAQTPQIPSEKLCLCMMDSLRCVANQIDDYNSTVMLDFCNNNNTQHFCIGIGAAFRVGAYGAFADCTTHQKFSFIANQVFLSKGKDPEACSSVGGTLKSTPAKAQNSSCKIMFDQAGPSFTGRVTSIPMLDDVEPRHSMSTAAKIGIVIGVLTLIVFLVTFAIVRRRKLPKKEEAKYEKAELAADSNNRTELAYGTVDRTELSEATMNPAELDSSPSQELDGQTVHEIGHDRRVETGINVHELGDGIPSELDGNPIHPDKPKEKSTAD